MMRARSSIRWSINGALVASMSSWLIPPRFSGRRAPRALPPCQPERRGGLRAGQRNFRLADFGLAEFRSSGFGGANGGCDGLRHVFAHHADRVEARVDLRLVVDRLEFLLHAFEVGLAFDLAHGVHELTLELGRHAPHLAQRLADCAHDAWQILRRNHRQSDDADNDHLADVKIEHGSPDRAQRRQTGARAAIPATDVPVEEAFSRPCECRSLRRRRGSRSAEARFEQPSAHRRRQDLS